MLTLSQQLLIEKFAQKVIDNLKTQLLTKPIPRKSVKYENGVRTESTFQAPVSASGKLARSLRYELTETELIIYSEDYIYFSVYGRKPSVNGTKPGKLIDSIKEWIKDKGITSDISENQLAYLITRKIHREGNSIYLFSGKKNTGLLENVITTEMLKEFNDKFTKQIEADIAEDFKKNIG
jgi:hypothetical protein